MVDNAEMERRYDTELKEKLAARLQEAGKPVPREFTPELIWKIGTLTNGGDEPLPPLRTLEQLIAAADPRDSPWYMHVVSLKPNKERPHVLFLDNRLYDGQHGRPSIPSFVERIAGIHGLRNCDIISCDRLTIFWETFFGTKKFLTESAHIPSLIVTTGKITFMDDTTFYEETDISGLLVTISRSWNIPLDFLPNPIAR